MPDGDRFERRLRGKGWRAVYRLGCASAPIEAVVDRILGAVAHAFREESTAGVQELFSHLATAVSAIQGSLFRTAVSQQTFDELYANTDGVLKDESYPEIIRLGQKAALRTFNEAEGDAKLFSREALKQQFTRNLAWELAERRCISATREGIMSQSHRDPDAQMKWEADVQRRLLDPCASLGKALLAETPTVIRAPKRQFKPKEMTLETLHEPLQVLGE